MSDEIRLLKVTLLMHQDLYSVGDTLEVNDEGYVRIREGEADFVSTDYIKAELLVSQGIAEWVEESPGWDEVKGDHNISLQHEVASLYKPQSQAESEGLRDPEKVSWTINFEYNKRRSLTDKKLEKSIQAKIKLYHIMKHSVYNDYWTADWADNSQKKYVILCVENELVDQWCYASRESIAFGSEEIRERFKSNESNMKLVHDYYMLDYKD